MDLYVWAYMLAKQNGHKVSTTGQFKKFISKIWDEMPRCVRSFEKRLKHVIQHKGRGDAPSIKYVVKVFNERCLHKN